MAAGTFLTSGDPKVPSLGDVVRPPGPDTIRSIPPTERGLVASDRGGR